MACFDSPFFQCVYIYICVMGKQERGDGARTAAAAVCTRRGGLARPVRPVLAACRVCVCVCVHGRACVCVCARACVHVCARACAHAPSASLSRSHTTTHPQHTRHPLTRDGASEGLSGAAATPPQPCPPRPQARCHCSAWRTSNTASATPTPHTKRPSPSPPPCTQPPTPPRTPAQHPCARAELRGLEGMRVPGCVREGEGGGRAGAARACVRAWRGVVPRHVCVCVGVCVCVEVRVSL